MRSSTASLILAFCAMLAIQAAPVDVNNVARSVSGVQARGEFSLATRENGYDANGNEIDANGNLVERGK